MLLELKVFFVVVVVGKGGKWVGVGYALFLYSRISCSFLVGIFVEYQKVYFQQCLGYNSNITANQLLSRKVWTLGM